MEGHTSWISRFIVHSGVRVFLVPLRRATRSTSHLHRSCTARQQTRRFALGMCTVRFSARRRKKKDTDRSQPMRKDSSISRAWRFFKDIRWRYRVWKHTKSFWYQVPRINRFECGRTSPNFTMRSVEYYVQFFWPKCIIYSLSRSLHWNFGTLSQNFSGENVTMNKFCFRNWLFLQIILAVCERELVGHKDLVYHVKVHDTILYSVSLDLTIRTWNMQNGKCLQMYELSGSFEDFRVDLKIMFDDCLLLTNPQDFAISMFSLKVQISNLHLLILLKTGKIVKSLVGHTNEIKTLFISAPHYLFSGAKDRTIRKWNLKEGTCVLVMRGHLEVVNSLIVLGCMWEKKRKLEENRKKIDLKSVQKPLKLQCNFKGFCTDFKSIFKKQNPI